MLYIEAALPRATRVGRTMLHILAASLFVSALIVCLAVKLVVERTVSCSTEQLGTVIASETQRERERP